MDILDIPELLEIPNPAPYDENPVATADFLMTALLHKQPAMLHAEFRDGNVRWLVLDSSKDERCVAESKSRGEFRSVLACFGHHYLNGQLYGGHIRRAVLQKGKQFACEIFMSNQGSTRFWIRAYAHAAQPQDATKL